MTSVQQPLEKSIKVLFGGDNGQSCIEGAIGKKVMMKEKAGIYTLSLEYLEGSDI